MTTTLTTGDIILACTPFALILGYFLINFFSYRKSLKQHEMDPEAYSDEFVRVNKVLLGVATAALCTAVVLYIGVYAAIKLQLFK